MLIDGFVPNIKQVRNNYRYFANQNLNYFTTSGATAVYRDENYAIYVAIMKKHGAYDEEMNVFKTGQPIMNELYTILDSFLLMSNLTEVMQYFRDKYDVTPDANLVGKVVNNDMFKAWIAWTAPVMFKHRVNLTCSDK